MLFSAARKTSLCVFVVGMNLKYMEYVMKKVHNVHIVLC